MRITKVKITNFCQHKNLEFDCDTSVFGIIGINGKGKTNILKAIKYGITGLLDENAQSYITHGESKSIVEVWFRKGGEEGYIQRVIASKSARLLRWQGQEIKSADDVERMMDAIRGADKYCTTEAAFIPQSNLGRMLFGAGSEREDMLIRLVNLHFCERRAGIVAGKLKSLSSAVEDLGPQLEVVETTYRDAALRHQDAVASLTGSLDVTAEIATVSRQLNRVRELGHERTRLVAANLQEGAVITEIKQILQSTQLADEAAIDAEIAALDPKVGQLEAYISAATSLEQDRKELTAATTQKQLLEERLSVLPDRSSELPAAENDLSAQRRDLSVASRRDALKSALADFDANRRTNQSQLDQLKLPGASKDAVARQQSQLDPNRALYRQDSAYLTARKEIESSGGVGTDLKCPKCALKLDAACAFPETTKELTDRLLTTITTITRGEAELSSAKLAWQTYDAAEARFKSIITSLSESMTARQNELLRYSEVAETNTINANITRLTSLVDEIRKTNNDRANTQTALGHIKSTITSLELRIERMASKHPELLILDSAQLAVEAKSTATHAVNRDRLTLLRRTKLNLQDRRGALSQIAINLSHGISQIAELESALAAGMDAYLISPVFAGSPISVADTTNEVALNNLQTTLAGAQELRTARQAAVLAAENTLRDMDTQKLALRTRMDNNAAKMAIIDELKQLTTVLSKAGLPLAYVMYRFKQLLALTQHNLTIMQANFFIEPAVEESLTFEFRRSDTDDALSLPMEKLSGGQKTRVALAFVLAVQQVLLPQLGIFSLDEPTAHLDEEGVESVATLLIKLGEILAASECQAFVVDHHPGLHSAFRKVLDLNTK